MYACIYASNCWTLTQQACGMLMYACMHVYVCICAWVVLLDNYVYIYACMFMHAYKDPYICIYAGKWALEAHQHSAANSRKYSDALGKALLLEQKIP